jgi:hypothetical protein
VPFRVFGSTVSEVRVAATSHPLLEFAGRSECWHPLRIAAMGSRARYAVGHFLDLAGFHERVRVESSFPNRHILSSTLAFLQSLSRSHLAAPTACAARLAPLLGFGSLQHFPEPGVHLPQGSPALLRSAFRVWLPSWRFTPPGTWPGLFHPDSVPGILPFGAFSSRKVAAAFPRPPHPPAVSSTRSPADEVRRPVRRASTSRLRPLPESLATGGGLTRPPLDAPLGFCLSRALHQMPWTGFHPPLPLRASRNAAAPTAAPPAP